jgi:hypothetical protein
LHAAGVERFLLALEHELLGLTVLQQLAYEGNHAEHAFMGHNMTLTMQALGLGGLWYRTCAGS